MINDRFGARQTFASTAPWLFVFLWSTGFIVARYATNDADPLSFLAARLFIAALILGAIAFISGAPRASASESKWSIVVGLGIHATYLGGVFIAIDLGLPSGVGALVGGLHPVITAVAGGALLGEYLTSRQWLGVVLGFSGVVLVVIERLTNDALHLPLRAVIAVSIATLGMSVGTLIQRQRCASTPLLWGSAVQYSGSAIALAFAAALSGQTTLNLTSNTIWSLVWSIGVLSITAVLTMLWLLQHRAAASVSSLFFLVPALSAVEAAMLFNEQLNAIAIAGFVVTIIGVALVTRAPANATES
ncbi:MAG: DMT family transporter [Actinobacteria bacterium]|nr:DMT family transporter [Ilumatobacteraceae bacterium]MDA0299396.1 DMT family transporter [Actinomycetota bacterium]MDA2995345.1 DMT family transporter [Actinomycetota bacterium]